MIKPQDSLLLAYTKLRTRKVRLIVTVVISAMLFSGLAAGSFVVRGVIASVDSFSQEGFGDRYILSATSVGTDPGKALRDSEVIDRAVALQKEQVAAKKAEAKRLGIEYDSASEPQAFQEFDGPNGKERNIDPSSVIGRQAIAEYQAKQPSSGLTDLKKLGKNYNVTQYYESHPIGTSNPTAGSLNLITDNKEQLEQKQQGYNPFSSGLSSFTSSWSVMSPELLNPFLLDGTTIAPKADGSIPLVAPYTAVEQMLKLKKLPDNAPEADKLARLKEVRAKAKDITFSVCYRNTTSGTLVQTALSNQRELTRNKTNKDYTKPSLIYDVPAEPCGAVRVSRDVRTYDEKALANKEEQFRQKFGEEPATQRLLQFRIVGIGPDPPDFGAASVSSLLASILSSNVGTGWYTPLEYRDKDPLLAKLFADDITGFSQPPVYYAEASTVADAQKMIKDGNCSPSFGGPVGPNGNPFGDCVAQGKPFFISPFGSSTLALDSFKTGFNKVFRVAAIVIATIAAIIMMGTLGRIIADSRRETAVFRAIGAKRLDIAQIYVTYSIMMSLLIATLAIIVGFGLSQIAQSRWSEEMTLKALIAYNAHDLNKDFNFYAWAARDVVLIFAIALAAGFVSTIIPLLRNLRRNPIRDMRDEN